MRFFLVRMPLALCMRLPLRKYSVQFSICYLFLLMDGKQMHEIPLILVLLLSGCGVRSFSLKKKLSAVLRTNDLYLLSLPHLFVEPVVDGLAFVVDTAEIRQDLALVGAGLALKDEVGSDAVVRLYLQSGFHVGREQNQGVEPYQRLLLQFYYSIVVRPMTFFSQQKRELGKGHRDANTPWVGPGKYEPEPLTRHRRHDSYAPFGSLVSKKCNKSQEIYLGPGQYNISTPIVKPSITRYENKNIIIVKINDEGGHQFKSRSNRFKDIESSPIGPGTYYSEERKVARRKAMSTSLYRPKISDKVRMINHQFYEQHQPTLLSDPPLLHQSKDKVESPQAKGVMNWSLIKRERFDLKPKEMFNEEDKRKALSEFNATHKKKIRPSAVFASKSIKSHFETQIYKTNNSFKAELRKMINYKDENPGPGSYEPVRMSSNKVLQKFQFFGSTVQRFPTKEQDVIGPGSYEIERKGSARQIRESISYSEQRHSYLPKNAIPGPGSYEVHTNFVKNQFSEKDIATCFGAHQQRFKTEKEEEDKTQVDTSFGGSNLKEREERREKELRLLKKIAEDHQSAVFSSKTNRFINKSESQNIDIGSYDVTQNDINARLTKQQKLIKQLEQCQLHKPPFLSSDQRFKPVKIHENEHKNCWCQVKSVEKQMIDHQSPVFISNDRRTAVFQQPFKAPPVGYYQSNDKGFIKSSFNSRFKKKNQNRIKKDLALRAKNANNKTEANARYTQKPGINI